MVIIMIIKRCSKCKQEKPIINFYLDKRVKKDGLQSQCKSCMMEHTKTPEYKEKQRKKAAEKRKDPKYKGYYYKYNKKYKQTLKGKERDKIYQQSKKGRFNRYKIDSKRRKIIFNLTFNDFLTFWQVPCYYCKNNIETIGLDRINSNIGYQLNNIISCCYSCNVMKSNMNQIDFINKCYIIGKLKIILDN